MALTPSNMLALGTKAPDFCLPDTVSGNKVCLSDYDQYSCLLVMFICNHCPYVLHVNEELVRLANDYKVKNVGIVAISSNDVEHYPQDSPEKMNQAAQELRYPFAYLYDESQDIAKAYDAACTPDFYVFDSDRKLTYRGRLCPSRPNSEVPVTGLDLRAALDATLMGKPVSEIQYPSMGCNIKWKKE